MPPPVGLVTGLTAVAGRAAARPCRLIGGIRPGQHTPRLGGAGQGVPGVWACGGASPAPGGPPDCPPAGASGGRRERAGWCGSASGVPEGMMGWHQAACPHVCDACVSAADGGADATRSPTQPARVGDWRRLRGTEP